MQKLWKQIEKTDHTDILTYTLGLAFSHKLCWTWNCHSTPSTTAQHLLSCLLLFFISYGYLLYVQKRCKCILKPCFVLSALGFEICFVEPISSVWVLEKSGRWQRINQSLLFALIHSGADAQFLRAKAQTATWSSCKISSGWVQPYWQKEVKRG